jgi:hypothetical protein
VKAGAQLPAFNAGSTMLSMAVRSLGRQRRFTDLLRNAICRTAIEKSLGDLALQAPRTVVPIRANKGGSFLNRRGDPTYRLCRVQINAYAPCQGKFRQYFSDARFGVPERAIRFACS